MPKPHTAPRSQFQTITGENNAKRNQVSSLERRTHTSSGWSPNKRRLVAQSPDTSHVPPPPPPLQSYGRGVQLRRGVQEPRPECREEGSLGADDQPPGLVAGGFRPLWAVLRPYRS